MICKRRGRVTCDHCQGTGRLTVLAESRQEHKVGVFLRGHEYEAPTQVVACQQCQGRGKVDLPHAFEFHHFGKVKTGFLSSYSAEIYRCPYCGAEEPISDSFHGFMRLSELNSL